VDQEVVDGYCDEEEAAQPGVQTSCRDEDGPAPPPQDDPARALAQRDAERDSIGSVVGPVMGLAPGDVPDLAVLLFGPVARGTVVGLSRSVPG
jgi:hypothetical protein